MRKFLFFLTFFGTLSIIIVFYLGLKTEKIYSTKDLIGKPISEVNLDLLNTDGSFNTSELKNNNFTLINFWASWCGPCRKEHKYLIELSKNDNIKILGVNFKDNKLKANKFLKKLGNPYFLIAKDDSGKKSIDFGVYGIPESILIDKNLVIIQKYIGPINKKDVKYIFNAIGS